MTTLITFLREYKFTASLLVLVAFASPSQAQSLEITASGRVKAIYLNTNISNPIYLVQLRAEEVALNGNSIRPRGLHLPEADETLFIMCEPGSDQLSSRLTIDDLPHVGNDVRAKLVSNAPGQWIPADSNWFEHLAPPTTTAGQNPADAANAPSPQVDVRGMTCEAIILEGRLAFAVRSVSASGPAHDAGFQVGDVVLAVAGQPLSSVAALKDFAAKPTPLKLSVIDVNTGQLAQVELASQKPQTSTAPEKSPPAAQSDSAAQIARSLGIEVTVSRIDLRRSALTVAKVNPLGAAAEAGVEVGDVIMAANDQPAGSLEELAAALPAAGGNTTLLIRDVRGGKDVPVEVTSRPSSANETSQDQSPQDTPSAGTGDALGLSTELAFYKGEAAVRITGVERGSPAARAGLQTGWLILAADGKPVLHPDELKSAEKVSASRLRLKVADPRAGREAEVEINR